MNVRYEEVPWILANCIGTDPEVWFPEGTNGWRDDDMVSRVCERCHIKTECLQWAIENDEVGYWGGQYFAARRRQDDDDTGAIHTGDNGDRVPDMRSETSPEMSPDIRNTESIRTHPATRGTAEVGGCDTVSGCAQ